MGHDDVLFQACGADGAASKETTEMDDLSASEVLAIPYSITSFSSPQGFICLLCGHPIAGHGYGSDCQGSHSFARIGERRAVGWDTVARSSERAGRAGDGPDRRDVTPDQYTTGTEHPVTSVRPRGFLRGGLPPGGPRLLSPGRPGRHGVLSTQ
eukprot:767510-Hanusia_phi.AAC.1